MFGEYIYQKALNKPLTKQEYYNIVKYLLDYGCTKDAVKMFMALNSFGMSKKEVLFLTLALRDSGMVFKTPKSTIEKHSTGGIGDSSSIVLVPLLASLGYKMVKTTGKSLRYTNGSLDRINAIPNFNTNLSELEIDELLQETNACFLSHNDNICPADKKLYDIMESFALNHNINFLASSIACKKLASSPEIILIDIKYGQAGNIKNYKQAKKLSKLLKYIFKNLKIKSIIFITNTAQIIGNSIGNALELQEAVDVLKGKQNRLSDISKTFAKEVVKSLNHKINKKDIDEIIQTNLSNGIAYDKFLQIIKKQNGDEKSINELFKPYKTANFVAIKDGYVGVINSLSLGEITRQLCEESHDNNIGIKLHASIGDFVKKGQTLLSFYYKNDEDLQLYKDVLIGSIRTTDKKIKTAKIIKKVIK